MDNKLFAKWLPALIFGVLMIVIYKTIDNYQLVFASLGKFLKIVSPFFFAILIVYFLYVPCKKLELFYAKSKRGFFANRARLFGVISVYLILLVIIIIAMIFIVPLIFNSLLDLLNSIPGYYDNILNSIEKLPENSIVNKETLTGFTEGIFKNLMEPDMVNQVTKGVVGLANGIINTIIALTVSLYILLDRENLAKYFDRATTTLLSPSSKGQLYKYLNQINHVIFTFIASKGLDSIINWVSITVILLILDVKYALLLGLIGGIANFIPYLGSLMAVIFITIMSLITGDSTQAIYTLILLTIFQQMDGNFIEPRILGTSLKMSPILVIFSVIVGGAYFGIIGMFLGVPIAAVLKQIFAEYLESKKSKELQPNS